MNTKQRADAIVMWEEIVRRLELRLPEMIKMLCKFKAELEFLKKGGDTNE